MTTVAPAVRALTVDDVPAVVELATLCEIAETGQPDPELIDWLEGSAAQADVRLFGIDGDGGLTAFGYIECAHGHSGLEADVRVRPGVDPAVGAPLLAAVRRAAAEFDPAKPVRILTNSQATAQRRWLEREGGRDIRHFWRMAIEFDDNPPAVPACPSGVTVRGARDDESDLRAVFDVVETAFAEHFGHTGERTFDEWLQLWRSRRGFDLSLWWVVEEAGAPIAALLALTFPNDDATTTGHIATLGTLPAARGRGIGTFLLRTAFREFHARGIRRVTLGVDSENGTGAVRLYQSVGMTAVNEWPMYEFEALTG